MLTWLRNAHGVVAVVATILAVVATWWQLGLPRAVFSDEILALHARIDAEAFNRDTRRLVSTRPWWSANPLGMLWPELGATLVSSGNASRIIAAG